MQKNAMSLIFLLFTIFSTFSISSAGYPDLIGAADSIIDIVSEKISTRDDGKIKLPDITGLVSGYAGKFVIDKLQKHPGGQVRAGTIEEDVHKFYFVFGPNKSQVLYKKRLVFERTDCADVDNLYFMAEVVVDYSQPECHARLSTDLTVKSPGTAKSCESNSFSIRNMAVSAWNKKTVEFVRQRIEEEMKNQLENNFDCEKFREMKDVPAGDEPQARTSFKFARE